MKKVILTIALFISIASILSAQDRKADETAINEVLNTMQNAWNDKNGVKYASVFAEVHDFIVWNGYYFPNQTKAGNARGHQQLYDGIYKTFDIKLKVDKIKFIRPDIAIVHVLAAGFQKGQEVPKDPFGLISMVMEKNNNSWQVISFHNLDLEAFQNKETAERSPIPVNVMYSNWYKN